MSLQSSGLIYKTLKFEMKKVLCLIDALGSGGAERQLVGLAGLLKNEGYDVTVGCYYSSPLFEGYISHLQEKQVPLVIEDASAKGFVGKVCAIRKLIKKTKADVVIAYKEQVNIKAVLACAFLGNVKLIVSQRNTYSNVSLRDKVCANIYRFADYVVPNSNSQTKVLAKHFPFLKDKVRTITNFVDTNKFVPTETSVETDRLRLLTVARINVEQKNAERYLKSLKILKDKGVNFHADWYGSPQPENAQEMLEAMVDELDIRDVFSFQKEESNVAAVYNSCDLFCLPSLYEGFPNVICEVMSCGKPVICGNVCDNPDIVKDSVNGFTFNPKDENDIVLAVEKFTRLSKEERTNISKRNREVALNKMSAASFVSQMKKLID